MPLASINSASHSLDRSKHPRPAPLPSAKLPPGAPSGAQSASSQTERITKHSNSLVEILGATPTRRDRLSWNGLAFEAVQVGKDERAEFQFCGSKHLLVIHIRGVRSFGETSVSGLAGSKLHQSDRRLTFVPSGRSYCETLEAHGVVSLAFVYLDPSIVPAIQGDTASCTPKYLFANAMLFGTALRLTDLIINRENRDQAYTAALVTVLSHELVLLCQSATNSQTPARGGLAPWQQGLVTAYVEEHLAEKIALNTLARLTRLSRHYFCRAFKQSLGVSPHRYHNGRRIERAKLLLAEHDLSITSIGFRVGFCDTSSFSATFRKLTGITPTEYLRNA